MASTYKQGSNVNQLQGAIAPQIYLNPSIWLSLKIYYPHSLQYKLGMLTAQRGVQDNT